MPLCKPQHLSSKFKYKELEFCPDSLLKVLKQKGKPIVYHVISGNSLQIATSQSQEEIFDDLNACTLIFTQARERIGLSSLSPNFLKDFWVSRWEESHPSSNIQSQTNTIHSEIFSLIDERQIRSVIVKCLEKEGVDAFKARNEYQQSILYAAAKRGRVDLLDTFLSKSKGLLDVNAKDNAGMTALHIAALRGQFAACEFLLQKADVAVMGLSFDGSTALHFLVGHHIIEPTPIAEFRRVLQLMMDKGLFINAQDKHGNTALHNAVMRGSVKMIKSFMKFHPSVDVQNNLGETPLHKACLVGNPDVVQLLVANGASLDVESSKGTPYQVAQNAKNSSILHFLRLPSMGNPMPPLKPSPFPGGYTRTSSELSIPSQTTRNQRSESIPLSQSCQLIPKTGESAALLEAEPMSEYKHIFQGSYFHRPHSCWYCGGTLWSLSGKGGVACVRSGCNYIAHSGTCQEFALRNSLCTHATPFKSKLRGTPYIPTKVMEKFSREELEMLEAQFLKLDKDGFGAVTLERFRKILGPILQEQGISQFLFSMFDKNNIGHITFVDFLEGFSVLFKGTPQEKLTLAFNTLDQEKRGWIERSNFDNLIRGMFNVLNITMNFDVPIEAREAFIIKLCILLSSNGAEKGKITLEQFLINAPLNLAFIESLGLLDLSQTLEEQAREIFLSGSCIAFGHHYWSLVQHLMIGLRISITEVSALECSTLKPTYFLEEFSYKFRKSEWFKCSHWEYSDFARKAFFYLRNRFGIDSKSYQFSLGPERILGNVILANISSLTEAVTTGRSGSFFLKSTDKRYLLKTLPVAEMNFLKSILPDYLAHLENYPNSLLPRFYGIHTMANKSEQFDFVVMENLFFSKYQIHEQYDLKGSKIDRHVEVDCITPEISRKDLDFNHSLQLSSEEKVTLLEQIERDSKFLEERGICDYSLLVGIHFLSEGEQLPGIRSSTDVSCLKKDFGGILSSDGKTLYFLGIIDVLTEYSFQKRSERALKVVKHFRDRKNISAMAPLPYRLRFQKYVASILS